MNGRKSSALSVEEIAWPSFTPIWLKNLLNSFAIVYLSDNSFPSTSMTEDKTSLLSFPISSLITVHGLFLWVSNSPLKYLNFACLIADLSSVAAALCCRLLLSV